MKSATPYLSIVLVGRNDNYGGDFNDRFHNSLHWLSWFAEKNKLPAEVIVVDYNPVPDNKPFVEMIDWPKNRKHLDIRLLQVPNAIHKQLINPEIRKTVPVFEFNAKNMGVRRARGEYILGTNADIVFHPSIVELWANKSLSKKYYYRADRFDYKKIDAYDFTNPQVTLRKIQQHVFRLMLKGYAYEVEHGENKFEEQFIRLKNWRRLMIDLHMKKIKPFAYRWMISINHDGYVMKYHTHCAGDFMLMHSDHWMSLRGYPEDTRISTHCDALFTVMASALGLQEKLLRWPVYHQDHERRYNTDFDVNKKDSDINLMFERFLRDTREMETTHRPKIVNAEDWGFAGETFEEIVL